MVSYKPVGSGFILWQRFLCSTDSSNVLENKDNLTFTLFIVDVKILKSMPTFKTFSSSFASPYFLRSFVSKEDVVSYNR